MNYSIPRASVVVGLQHGDEGKGCITKAYLETGRFTQCVRYCGGPNAGHTVYHHGEKVVTHAIPMGVVLGIASYIGPGCVLDPMGFFKELEELCISLGRDVSHLVKISPRTHIITAEHIERDMVEDKIGSTKRGIAPVYSDKMLRKGIRAENVRSLDLFIEETEVLNDSDNNILFEGAQGLELDPDLGDYPFVTSSSSLPGMINTCGVPLKAIEEVIGVAKVYETYVGKKLFEPYDPVFQTLRTLGGEYGATTGRPRQCNWLNLDRLNRAAYISGATKVILNKTDILEKLGIFKLIHDREIREFGSLDEFEFYIQKCGPRASLVFSGDPEGI